MRLRRRIHALYGAAGLAMTIGGVAQTANAQITPGCELDAIQWTFADSADGSGAVLTNSGLCVMDIDGGDNGVNGGETTFTGNACVDMTISATLDYSSVDSGFFDQAFYSINGVQTIVASNSNQGSFNVQFDVEAGDSFGFGVLTEDGLFGGGFASITNFRARSSVAQKSLNWNFVDNANGSGLITGSCIDVVGGDSEFGGTSAFATQTCLTGDVTAIVNYTSVDSGFFDGAYYAVNGSNMTITDNSAQGTFPVSFPVKAGDDIELGVFTEDGLFGAGVALFDEVTVSTAPQRLGDFPWTLNDSASGSASLNPGFSSLDITGGDNGLAGETEYVAPACVDLCVRAIMDYSSADSGFFDLAYYHVNGVNTTVASNSNQGTFAVEFNVPAGSTFGFGVFTEDGTLGPGVLNVSKIRAFARPTLPCPTDFSNNGAQDVFDFVDFQQAFLNGRKCADFNKDGLFNVFDFPPFQQAFSAGPCP